MDICLLLRDGCLNQVYDGVFVGVAACCIMVTEGRGFP